MPITGPGGPTGPRPTSNVSPTTSPTPAAPAAPPASPAAAQGWTPGSGGNARQIGNAKIDLPPAAQLAPPSTSQLQFQGALNTFTSKMEVALNQDAMSLAQGKRPVREGDALTPDQNKAMQDAATEFIKSIPIGALSPEVAASIQGGLKAQGIDARDVATTSLGGLGGIGQDVAKSLIGKLKEGSPTAYYSLAATAAAAAGVVAWTGGSAKLEKLGIKPEIKQGFFDDKLSVKLAADFGAHFSDFKATATVEGKVDLNGNGTLTGSVTANTRTGFEGASVGYNLQREDFNLSATANFDRGGLANAGVSGTWRPNENLSLSGSLNHDFRTNATTATAEAAWKVNQNVDLALSASHNSQGDNYAGIGVRIKF